MDFGKNETPVADEADSFVSSNQILTDLEDLQIQSPMEKDNQDFLKHKTASPKSKTIFQFLFLRLFLKRTCEKDTKLSGRDRAGLMILMNVCTIVMFKSPLLKKSVKESHLHCWHRSTTAFNRTNTQ